MLDKDTTVLPNGYEVIKFFGNAQPDLLDLICKLRLTVWKSQNVKMVGDFSNDSWTDSEEERSVHWAILHAEKLIAASRMTIYQSISEIPDGEFYSGLAKFDTPISYFTRDVVSIDHQSKGIGNYLNKIRIIESKHLEAKTILASIPEYRLNSFIKLGFKLIREPKYGYVFPETKWAVVTMNI